MSDTFGALYMMGQQNNLPGGGTQGIGPYAIAASGVQDSNTWVVDTAETVPVPAGAAGALIIPVSGTDIRYKTVSGDTGTYQGAQPTFLCFDSAHVPSNIYLTSAGSVTVVVQFI